MALETETVIDLTTVARVRKMLQGMAIDAGGNDAMLKMLIRLLSRDAMVRIMKRAVESKSRTERFDIAQGQRDFWILGSPIDTGESITIYHNTSQPRVFNQANDLVSSDYIICNPDMAEEGRIHIESDYDAYVDALQIAYTGGMATQCCLTGTDGATAASGVFNSAGSTFDTDGVVAGHILIMDTPGGANNLWYEITAVNSETQLVVTPDFSNESETGATWEVSTGFISAYEDISGAIDFQAAFMWMNKDKFGIKTEGVPGMMSMAWHRPVNWLHYPRMILESYARKV